MSTSWLLDALPPPKILVLPPGAVDLGEAEAAIELWEHYSGKTLDPTQRLSVQVMMALGPDGRWAASTTGREMPRQNGKGDEIEVVELWGLVQRAERIAHTIHEAVLLATQTQQRMLSVLEGHADLRRKILRKWQGTGQQMIEMRNGGVIWYRTRSNGGSRGVDDVDRIVADEAQHATEEQLAAVSPTGFANRNPQLNAFGTGGLEGMSRWWWQMRKRALSDDPGAFGYVGHTAETVHLDEVGRVVQEPVDASDRTLWPLANPAIVSGRGRMEFLEEQFRNLPDLFAREHLGVWDPPPDGDSNQPQWEVWPKDSWNACASPTATVDTKGWLPGSVCLSMEITPDRTRAAIGVAGDSTDGKLGWDLAASNDGVGWLVPTLVKVCGEREVSRIVVDPKGPAGSLIEPLTEALEDAGLETPVVEITFEEFKRTTGDALDAVLAGDVVHRHRPELDASVAHATKRASEVWLIERRTNVAAEINAVVLARWGHLQDANVEEFMAVWT